MPFAQLNVVRQQSIHVLALAYHALAVEVNINPQMCMFRQQCLPMKTRTSPYPHLASGESPGETIAEEHACK